MQDEICTHGPKTVPRPISLINFSLWNVISLFNVLFNVNLQSTYLLEWNSLVLRRFRPFLSSRMCRGPGPALRRFFDLVPCSPRQPISFELTVSGQRFGYCLLTVKSFCLLKN